MKEVLTPKQKRLEILAKIDVLEKKRCSACEGTANNSGEMKCKCPAAVEIRKLGVAYESVSKETRAKRIKALIKQLKQSYLTKDLYMALRELEVTSKEIQKHSKMKESDFVYWKRENGLVNPNMAQASRNTAKKKRHKKTIDANLMEIARQNGIPEHVVEGRIFDKGWDIQRAITTASRKKSAEVVKWRGVAKENGINYNTFYKRIQTGIPMEIAATTKPEQQKSVKV